MMIAPDVARVELDTLLREYTEKMAEVVKKHTIPPGPQKTKSGTYRRSEAIDALAHRIGDFVSKAKGGVGSAEIRRALKIAEQDLQLPLARAVEKGLVARAGLKKGTKYYPVR